jgi:predicted O-linked N-acetylglucosamine transferase (SPINDLY family)
MHVAGQDNVVLRRSQIERAISDGLAAHDAGHFADAAALYRGVLERDPAHFDALQLLGLTLASAGSHEDAIPFLKRALALRPGDAGTRSNLGRVYVHLGRFAEAIAMLRLAVDADPGNPVIRLNLGNAQREINDHDGAIVTLLALVQAHPAFAPGHFELGVVLRASGRPREAGLAFQRAIDADPDHAFAHIQRGLLHADSGDIARALTCLHAAIAVASVDSRPSLAVLAAAIGLEVGDWSLWTDACATIAAHRERPADTYDPMRVMIFPHDDAGIAGITARFATSHVQRARARTSPPSLCVREGEPIRLAYLSPDFGDHPVCRLVAPALALHDRTRFQVTAYGWGRPREGAHRQYIAGAVDRFVDVTGISDAAVAELLRREGTDIAVDLAGYTANHRPRIFVEGAAPIQVGWLGYPGTIANGALQYLVADEYAVPRTVEPYFSEAIVRLHGGYMPYDTSTPIAVAPSRHDAGLPEHGVVLACFALTRKISPLLFEAWMAALRAAPDAVLWLASGPFDVLLNLRSAAAALGVSPERIVFAPRAPNLAQYLARYQAADLALDTFPYGSHSTALDVLWAGCPLLAVTGPSMAGRVSSSILAAAGLTDLAQPDLACYRDRLVELVTQPAALAELRHRTALARQHAPLFDIPGLVRRLETAYATMHARALGGQPAESFDVN